MTWLELTYWIITTILVVLGVICIASSIEFKLSSGRYGSGIAFYFGMLLLLIAVGFKGCAEEQSKQSTQIPASTNIQE